MAKMFFLALALLAFQQAQGQVAFPKNLLSINGFRNPSIGLEWQHHQVSLHAGYYVTNFESNVTTEFLKAGLTYWFLPFGQKTIPSSFYVGAGYLRGLTRDYEDQSAFSLEAGARWYAWKGLNFRLGIIALAAQDQTLKINPTPSISYSFSL